MPFQHKDPLRELLDLQERMNRLFDETLTRERFYEEPRVQVCETLRDSGFRRS